MLVAVVGSTGRTGAQVVEQALAGGHVVRALARRPDAVVARAPRLEVAQADVLDHESLSPALAGVDAVVSAVGAGTSRRPTTVYSEGTANLLAAMRAAGARRIAVVSAVPAGPTDALGPLDRHLVLPLLDRLFGATYEDMRRMEEILLGCDIAWTALRAPRLTGAPRHRYRLSDRPLPRGRSIAHADLARALLDVVSIEDAPTGPVYVAA